MSTASQEIVVICSFCDQRLSVTPQHVGRRVKCPKCARRVALFPNQNVDITSRLACTWYYLRPRLFLQAEEIGPLSDEQFLKAVRSEAITQDMEVKSSEVTKGKWVAAARILLPAILERVEQLHAEKRRIERNQERRRDVESQNMQTLCRAVAQAFSDGKVTPREREQLIQFARKARIPEETVNNLLSEQSNSLLKLRIEEALEDGILEPNEKQRIGDLANSLGISISLSNDQSRRLSACEFAWQIASGIFKPSDICTDDVSLNSNEKPLTRIGLEWFEVVQQRKPSGIRLDEKHSLKAVGSGDCMLTDKRVMLVGEYSAKKATLSSIAQVRRYRDGVFCNRSTGKSIFLRPYKFDEEPDLFAMLLEYRITSQPVLGSELRDNFIPDVEPLLLSDFVPSASWDESADADNEPRYTFRVVGDHIADRACWIDEIRIGDPIRIHREPGNPHDSNAIAVYDSHQRQLGYLKREVASWFAPMLDRGCCYRSQAYRKPSSGGLIVGMFE